MISGHIRRRLCRILGTVRDLAAAWPLTMAFGLGAAATHHPSLLDVGMPTFALVLASSL
jgi:hypothetical protein